MKALILDRKLLGICGLLIFGTILYFHATNLHFSGALIRDETNSIKLAIQPLAEAIQDDLNYDSFPPLSIIVFHFWSLITDSDQGFRFLGFLIGIATVLAFWFNSSRIGLGVPIISWSLFELNFVAVRYSQYIRAHSLGVLFIILTFGLVWKLTKTEKFNWKIFLGTAVMATLSVQTTYQNAFLLLAICIAGILVVVEHKQWKKVWEILGIGAIAAISLIPYVRYIQSANDWMVISKSVTNPRAIWYVLTEAFGPSGLILAALIICSFIWGLLVFFILPSREKNPISRKDLFIFSTMTLLISSAGLLILYQKSRIPTQPYYFLSLMAITAICLESILFTLAKNDKFWIYMKIFIALIFLSFSFNPTLELLKTRTTNIDLIAKRLPVLTTDQDLILVNPWQVGVGFDRYYHGRTSWLTLPDMGDLSIYRYPVMQQKMVLENPTASTFIAIEQTLRSGGRIWLVGTMESTVTSKPTATHMQPYMEYWSAQLQQFLDQHTTEYHQVDLEVTEPVTAYENYPLTVYQGWKE